MKVLYDITRLAESLVCGHHTGVERVDWRYARWLAVFCEDFQPILQGPEGFKRLPAEDWEGALEDVSTSKVSWRALNEKFERVAFRELFEERGWGALLSLMPMATGRRGTFPEGKWDGYQYVNIGHCLRHEAALLSLPADLGRIFFLHDVIPLTHPETQRATSRAHFRKLCDFIGHPRAQVIVSSQTTLDAIRSLPEAERAPLDLVEAWHVCPLAVEEGFIEAERLKRLKTERLKEFMDFKSEALNAEDAYFLSVGTVEPRKNLQLLVEVWERLLASGGAVPKLIWVGKIGWTTDDSVMERFGELERSGVAALRTGLSDGALQKLMWGARALLFPSVVEGWGLPLSEALAMGVPVIASDIPVFREIGQRVPELVMPEYVEDWLACIQNYAAEGSRQRLAQLERLEGYVPTTWDEHFETFSESLARPAAAP